LGEDGATLGCLAEVEHLRQVVTNGTSANEQVRIYREALASGAPKTAALRAVVDWAARTTIQANG
jgi:carboxylate-amine ligase